MKKTTCFWKFGWIFLLIIGTRVTAQSYLVHKYIEDSGLGNSRTFHVVQDKSGQIWFSTQSGVSVYDGTMWRNYDQSHGLGEGSLFRLAVDEAGTVWGVSNPPEFQIYQFDGKKWLRIPTPQSPSPDLNLSAFLVRKSGEFVQLFVGTSQNGVYIQSGDKWQHLTRESGLPGMQINGIACCSDSVFIATDGGLACYRNGAIDPDFSLKRPPGEPVIRGLGVNQAQQGVGDRLWLAGSDWLGYLTNDSLKVVKSHITLTFDRISHYLILEPDIADGLFYGNRYAFFHYKRNGTIENLNRESGLLAEGTNGLLLDREKNLWISTLRGVSKITSLRFANYFRDQGLLANEVTAILESEPGKIVLGHKNGLTFFEHGRFRSELFVDDPATSDAESRVLDLDLDNQKNIWAAVSSLGVFWISSDGHRKWYSEKEGLPRFVTSVRVTPGGEVYASASKYFYKLKGGRFEIVDLSSMKVDYIRRIFIDKKGKIFLATAREGVIYQQENGWKQARSETGGNSNWIYAVLPESSGEILVGTLGGLFKLENERLVKYQKNGFQIDRPVYLIMRDHLQRLWFGTDDGVIRVDGGEIRKYTIYEGLSGFEINRAAGCQDSFGQVWFGTEAGLSCYQEEYDLSPSDIPPPVVELKNIEVGHEFFSLSQPNHFRAEKNTLIFHFRGISFIDEKKVEYRYKLAGFEDDWVPENPSNQQQIRYTNLPPGTYHFWVQVKNALGVWSAPAGSSEIVINQPFWLKWWFFLVVILFVGFITFSIQSYISEKRHSALLERQVYERTAQLEASEKRYRQMFENNRAVMLLVQPENGMIIDANQAACDFYGHPSEKIKTFSWLEFNYSPMGQSALLDRLGDLGQGKFISLRQALANSEIRDTEVYPCSIEVNQQKNYFLIINDVTERILAEKALQENEEFLRLLIDTNPNSIFVKNREGEYILANKTMAALFGVSPDEMIGKTDLFFVAKGQLQKEEAEKLTEIDHFVINRQAPQFIPEVSFTPEFGKARWFQIMRFPLIQKNIALRLLGVGVDITERKLTAESLKAAKDAAEAANHSKSQFLANMSHEIRTPMNGIIGLTEMVLNTKVSQQQREYLTMARKSAGQLLNILNDILDFSKIEAGQLHLEAIEFDLRAVIEDICDIVIPRVEQKGLELNFRITQETPTYLIGDPGRLRQIMVNLVGNAIKFTESGEIFVLVQLRELLGQFVVIEIQISDTGIGIPPERQKDIFEIFTQADSSMTRRFGGTGLGLTISRQLVEKMGGRLRVESQSGKGSRFIFTIRLPVQARQKLVRWDLPADTREIRVLVIDAYLRNSLILNEILISFKCKPESVGSIPEALERLRTASDFKILIIESRIISEDPEVQINQIRREAGYEKLPVILLRSIGSSSFRELPERISNIWMIPQPIKQSQLYNTMISALGLTGKASPSQEIKKDLNLQLQEIIARIRQRANGLTILLAEDNIVNQKVALALLKRVSLKVEIAANGKAAVTKLQQKKFDLVLMDIQMPEMDGLSATCHIRNEMKLKDLPIVAMTAHAMKGDREKCLACGMNDYISKPIEPIVLYQILEKWMLKT